jgi:hypothetical protein
LFEVKFKQALGLIVGLVVGITGGILYSKSLRPDPGSMQDRMEIAEEELGKARRNVRAMERHVQRQEAMRDGRLRKLARDIKDGKEVNLDDLFATMKPWMRQMSPVFERLRQINEVDWADARVSEWGRNYDLSDAEKEQLKDWFAGQSRTNAERLTEVVTNEETGFVDLIRATEYGWQDAEGVESLMEGFLEGEELESFRAERLADRVESVQNEADRSLQRLDEIVELDDAQHEELFGVLIRGSEDYRPDVKPEGFTGEATPLDREARDAMIQSVLKPEQVQRLNEVREERRVKAESQLRRAGMVLPKDWDLLEGDLF